MLNQRLISFVLLLNFFGCSGPSETDPIIRVNNEVITVRHYLNLYDSLKPKDVELDRDDHLELRNLALKTLVRRAVILTTAREKNVQVDEKELLAGIEGYKTGYSKNLFQESLLEGMLEEAEWQERVRQNLMIEKLFEASNIEFEEPSLDDAHAYFEENSSLFERPAMAKAQHIIVGDKELAEKVRSQWKDEPRSFLKLARQHSTGPEASERGLIEVEKDVMPESLDEALFDLPLKRISEVVETPFGYHIVRVIDRNSAVNLSFPQVKNDILKRLREERKQLQLQRFEEQLIRAAEIEYNRELIAKL